MELNWLAHGVFWMALDQAAQSLEKEIPSPIEDKLFSLLFLRNKEEFYAYLAM